MWKNDRERGEIMEEKVKYIARASLGRRNKIKASAVLFIVAAAVCVGLVLVMYNLIKGSFLFFIGYLIAVALGILYIIIEINALFTTFIAVDKNKLYMKNWVNGFVSYDLHHKAKLIREYLPAKTAIVEIKVKDIKECMVGSVNYVKRYCRDNRAFLEKVDRLEHLGLVSSKTMRKMDIFYVETTDGDACFMPVTNFDRDELVKLLNYIEKRAGASIRCNNKEMVRKRKTLGSKF